MISMIRKAPAMTVRQNLGELLNEVQYKHDSILITKGGKPVAAIVDIDLFRKIRLLNAEFEKLASNLANAYNDVDPITAENEIKAALARARRT